MSIVVFRFYYDLDMLIRYWTENGIGSWTGLYDVF